MLYDTYRQKMQCLAGRLRVVLRIASICLIILTAAVTLTALFECCRGILLSGLSDQSILYGENVRMDARAFLCPVQYEVQDECGAWQPFDTLTAGVYSLRGVSENRFGIRRYTDTVTITIQPRDLRITVAARTWNYGEALPYTMDDLLSEGLLDGDSVANAAFDADLSMPGIVSVTLAADTLRIENPTGADVTACYRITATAGVGIIENHITISAYHAVKVYDGTPLSAPQYHISAGELLPGHRLEAAVEGSVTDAGQTKNRIVSYGITDAAGADMSGLYAIETADGILEVLPCPVEISTGSVTEFFDRQTLSCPDYWISGGALPDGYEITVEMPTILREKGSVINRYGKVTVWKMTDGEQVDMTHNFRIQDGNLGMLRLY